MYVKVTLVLFLFIGGVMSSRSSAQTLPDHNSPFGITTLSTINNTINFANDIHAKSVRLAGPQAIAWDRVKSQRWSENDKIISDFYNSGLEISVVVLGGNPVAAGTLEAYSAFVSEMAERYDRDGINDAPGSPVVTYFEIDNEPDLYEPNEKTDWKGILSETKDYALVLKTAYEAIRSARSQAKVAIAGMAFAAPISKEYYDSILTELGRLKTNEQDKFFDVYNFHYYGFYRDYLASQISDVKLLLSKHGYSNIELIVTETATYAGTSMFGGISGTLPYQSEGQQAESLVKRYVYSKSNGIDKIYWFMQHAENGLSSSSGSKLLAYYTFKKMIETLEGSDWKNVEVIREVDGIHLYKFTKQNGAVYIAWNDSSVTRTITISGITTNEVKKTEAVPKFELGADVPDYTTAFQTDTLMVTDGATALTLGKRPVFIEPFQTTSVKREGENTPIEFLMYQNYPNPFNPSTSIVYNLAKASAVKLTVCNALGQVVAVIVDRQQQAGRYSVNFNASQLPSGLYFIQFKAGSFSQVRKMMVLK
jgi:hypothetical protein